MTADTLDHSIRRAVVQIVDTSPPPPELTAGVAPAPRPHRRGALVAGSAVVVAIVAAVAIAANRSTAPVAPTRSSPPVAQLHVEALASISYDRDEYAVPAGRVHVHLSGATGHTFTIDSPTTRRLLLTTDGGGPHDATVSLGPGTYAMGSTVPGHRAAGMVATLHVLRRPIEWVTPDGEADPDFVLPDTRTATDAQPGRIGTELERLLAVPLQGDVERTTPPDLFQFGEIGDVGRTVASYSAGSPAFEAAVYRLSRPVSAATLGAGHPTRFATTTRGSRLVYVDDLNRVFLVRRDGTVLQVTLVWNATPGQGPATGLTLVAEALDRPALSRAVG